MFKIYDISMTIEPSMQLFNNSESKKPSITNVTNHTTAKRSMNRASIWMCTAGRMWMRRCIC